MTEERKLPRSIAWTGYSAITLLLILPLSVLMVRAGAWQQGLLLYAVACLGATALLALFILFALLPAFAGWRREIRGRALFTLPGALLTALLVNGGDHPRIHDITTDTEDPPTFSEEARQRRGDASNPLELKPSVIEQQIAGYPGLGTRLTALPIEAAYDLAGQVAEDLGWEIYHRDRSLGIIEAVDTTAIMGFRDDVVIRVRSNADGTLLDLRSVSRVGIGDLGANAARIEAFFAAFGEREGGA
jgi:hypothetical protein